MDPYKHQIEEHIHPDSIVGRNEMMQMTNGVTDEEAHRMSNRVEIIKAKMDRLQEELFKLEKYGEDDYDEGAVIIFSIQFVAGGTVYSYAAIKTPLANGGKWFTTGTRPEQKSMTWEALKTFWSRTIIVEEPQLVTKAKDIAKR